MSASMPALAPQQREATAGIDRFWGVPPQTPPEFCCTAPVELCGSGPRRVARDSEPERT
jgi:hypothetical protein